MADIKTDPNKKDIIKRFSLSQEEKDDLQQMQVARSIKIIELEALENYLVFKHSMIKRRLDIDESKAPKGYIRRAIIDWAKFEMLQIDKPILEEKTVN